MSIPHFSISLFPQTKILCFSPVSPAFGHFHSIVDNANQMSYSSVHQGLQSIVEPRLIETEPRVLKLKLAPPTTNHNNKKYEPQSFLQTLSNICKKTEDPEAENAVYVHPSVKSTLSAKSLELCTESLGCETGSNASDSTDDMSLFSLESSSNINTTFSNTNYSKPKRLKKNQGRNFPPPLTSMRGVQVRSHRKDGRLILEAVAPRSSQPYFEAERGNGRLRLRVFESVVSYCDDEGNAEQEEEEEACDEEEDGVGEDEMGITKFVRLSSCKQSGNRVFGDGYFERRPVSLCL